MICVGARVHLAAVGDVVVAVGGPAGTRDRADPGGARRYAIARNAGVATTATVLVAGLDVGTSSTASGEPSAAYTNTALASLRGITGSVASTAVLCRGVQVYFTAVLHKAVAVTPSGIAGDGTLASPTNRNPIDTRAAAIAPTTMAWILLEADAPTSASLLACRARWRPRGDIFNGLHVLLRPRIDLLWIGANVAWIRTQRLFAKLDTPGAECRQGGEKAQDAKAVVTCHHSAAPQVAPKEESIGAQKNPWLCGASLGREGSVAKSNTDASINAPPAAKPLTETIPIRYPSS